MENISLKKFEKRGRRLTSAHQCRQRISFPLSCSNEIHFKCETHLLIYVCRIWLQLFIVSKWNIRNIFSWSFTLSFDQWKEEEIHSIHLLVSHHRYHRLAIKRLGRMSILSAQRKSSSSSSDMVCYLLFRAHIIIDAQANALIESHSMCEKHSFSTLHCWLLRANLIGWFFSLSLILALIKSKWFSNPSENIHLAFIRNCSFFFVSIEIWFPRVCIKVVRVLKEEEF